MNNNTETKLTSPVLSGVIAVAFTVVAAAAALAVTFQPEAPAQPEIGTAWVVER